MDGIATLALPFFALMFLGFGAGKWLRIPDQGLAGLQVFILYFALPALFFRLISNTPIEQLGEWRFILATTSATLIVFALGFIVGMIVTRRNVAEATMQGLAASYANNGHMGPGLALAAFGPAAAVPTALVFCFDNLLMFTLAPVGVSIGRRDGAGPGTIALLVLRRVFTHPFIIATILGVIAAALHFRPPEPIDHLLELLSNAAAPCALFTLGIVLAKQPLKRLPVDLPILMFLKLVGHPLLTWVMLSLFSNFEPVWVYTAVLIASLPMATNVFVIAQQYGVWVNRASSAVLISTVVAVFSVTGVLALIGSGALPVDLFP
ncbi:MAG: AEC family transporter [Bauldia sp.]|nr:AEC family transporter [Bauldia sp.]